MRQAQSGIFMQLAFRGFNLDLQVLFIACLFSNVYPLTTRSLLDYFGATRRELWTQVSSCCADFASAFSILLVSLRLHSSIFPTTFTFPSFSPELPQKSSQLRTIPTTEDPHRGVPTPSTTFSSRRCLLALSFPSRRLSLHRSAH